MSDRKPVTVVFEPETVSVVVAFGGEVYRFASEQPPLDMSDRDKAIARTLLSIAIEEVNKS
jgi:hypothetical protein